LNKLVIIKYIDKIAPVPLLLIHGTADSMVPIGQTDELFKKAKQPKTLFKVKGGTHTDCLERNHGEYRKKMLDWLDNVLG